MSQKLNEQAMTKISLTFIIAAFKAEKFWKIKWSNLYETPGINIDFHLNFNHKC